MYLKPNARGIIDKKANTTIKFAIIHQRLLFSFECVLKIFCFFVCLLSIWYYIEYCHFTVLLTFSVFFLLDFTMEKM